MPQLLNILKGEMSFIGPRPLLMQYLKSLNNSSITLDLDVFQELQD